MTSLPDKPSELIRVALSDLAKCEGDLRYRINMGVWHFPIEPDVCHVCLAGSVMAQSLNVPPDKYSTPTEFAFEVTRKLHALNRFQSGNLEAGLYKLGLSCRNLPQYVDIPSYADCYPRRTFHEAMHTMADMLEKEGL